MISGVIQSNHGIVKPGQDGLDTDTELAVVTGIIVLAALYDLIKIAVEGGNADGFERFRWQAVEFGKVGAELIAKAFGLDKIAIRGQAVLAGKIGAGRR